MLTCLKHSIAHEKSSPPLTAPYWHQIDRLLWEYGHCLSAIANSEELLDSVDIQTIILALHWLWEKLPGPFDLPGFDSSMPTRMISDTASISTRDLDLLLRSSVPLPSTPKRTLAQDVAF